MTPKEGGCIFMKKIEVLFSNAVIKSICHMVIIFAPLISNGCFTLWYQEKEPTGFDEFIKRIH